MSSRELKMRQCLRLLLPHEEGLEFHTNLSPMIFMWIFIIIFISYFQNIIIVSEYIQSQKNKKGVH